MTQKDFVVSGDGHLLEPIDLFKTRLPEAPARPRRVGRGLRDRRAVRRGRRPASSVGCTRPATRAGPSRATARPAGARPRAIPSSSSRTWTLDGVDAQVMHPNLSLFGLYSDDHELSIAHARVYNDYVIERFTPVLRPHRAHRADPAHRRRRRGRRDRAGRGRWLPGRAPAGHPAAAATTRATSTRCGRRSATRGCSRSSTPRPAA